MQVEAAAAWKEQRAEDGAAHGRRLSGPLQLLVGDACAALSVLTNCCTLLFGPSFLSVLFLTHAAELKQYRTVPLFKANSQSEYLNDISGGKTTFKEPFY